ncbi:MAG: hypothetical protein NC206_07650 [Bacteroides sp.]|nr:hypothetical protein [Roseburia sp.]MCM1346944.1 hypothetical protein [Bacteroides sp.]MCM1421511.1 hypothetical protein [Bacteroides sp.]
MEHRTVSDSLRQVFKFAILEYNDYDNSIIHIIINPCLKVMISSADCAEKRAITQETCREFFLVFCSEKQVEVAADIPDRSIVMLKIVNLDKSQTVVNQK